MSVRDPDEAILSRPAHVSWRSTRATRRRTLVGLSPYFCLCLKRLRAPNPCALFNTISGIVKRSLTAPSLLIFPASLQEGGNISSELVVYLCGSNRAVLFCAVQEEKGDDSLQFVWWLACTSAKATWLCYECYVGMLVAVSVVGCSC